MAEKYKIEVSDECVEIMGTLTIREAFDFLNFFEKEGYTTLEDWGERTTLYLRKRDLDQELTKRVNEETLESLAVSKDCLIRAEESNKELKQRVIDLESLIKTLMTDEGNRIVRLNNSLKKAQKEIGILRLELKCNGREPEKTLGDANEDQKIKYKTLGQTVSNFYLGQRVKVICLIQDMRFFGGQIAHVNSISYITGFITVQFDEPMIYESGQVITEFSFEAEDLCDEGKALEIEKETNDNIATKSADSSDDNKGAWPGTGFD